MGAHTFPFAVKINDVISMHAAIKVSRSVVSVSVLERITMSRDTSHKVQSFFVKCFMGLFISASNIIVPVSLSH